MLGNNIAIQSDLIGFTSISDTIPKNKQIQKKTDTIRINQNDFVYLKSNQNKSRNILIIYNYYFLPVKSSIPQ